jgi:hypothetical protein
MRPSKLNATGHKLARGEATNSVETFACLEDRGSKLFVRVKRADGGSVPAVISREALVDHFAAGEGPRDLAHAYLSHQHVINEKVLQLDPSGSVYSDSNPMLLGTGDFEVP